MEPNPTIIKMPDGNWLAFVRSPASVGVFGGSEREATTRLTAALSRIADLVRGAES